MGLLDTGKRVVGLLASHPQRLQNISDAARGIRMGAQAANRATGGMLSAGIGMLPGGSMALKGADLGLRAVQGAAALGARFASSGGSQD